MEGLCEIQRWRATSPKAKAHHATSPFVDDLSETEFELGIGTNIVCKVGSVRGLDLSDAFGDCDERVSALCDCVCSTIERQSENELRTSSSRDVRKGSLSVFS